MNKEPLVGRDKSFYIQLNELISSKIKNKEELDKRFFYIISSFFAFSILLVQFIKDPVAIYYLLIAWYSNLWALISHLFAYLAADKGFDQKMEKYINMDRNNDNEKEEVFKFLLNIKKPLWGKILTITEIIGYISFIAAIIFLLLFIYSNLILK